MLLLPVTLDRRHPQEQSCLLPDDAVDRADEGDLEEDEEGDDAHTDVDDELGLEKAHVVYFVHSRKEVVQCRRHHLQQDVLDVVLIGDDMRRL